MKLACYLGIKIDKISMNRSPKGLEKCEHILLEESE